MNSAMNSLSEVASSELREMSSKRRAEARAPLSILSCDDLVVRDAPRHEEEELCTPLAKDRSERLTQAADE
jgi:hypothetical protein